MRQNPMVQYGDHKKEGERYRDEDHHSGGNIDQPDLPPSEFQPLFDKGFVAPDSLTVAGRLSDLPVGGPLRCRLP